MRTYLRPAGLLLAIMLVVGTGAPAAAHDGYYAEGWSGYYYAPWYADYAGRLDSGQYSTGASALDRAGDDYKYFDKEMGCALAGSYHTGKMASVRHRPAAGAAGTIRQLSANVAAMTAPAAKTVPGSSHFPTRLE